MSYCHQANNENLMPPMKKDRRHFCIFITTSNNVMKPEILQTKNFEVIGRLLNYPVICLYYKRIKIIEYHYHTNLTGELFKFLKIIRIRKQINKISDDELLILGTYLIYYLMDIYMETKYIQQF